MDKGQYKIVRVIDRVVMGGPTKHVVLLCSQLDKSRFHSLLVTGSAARGETECLDYAAANQMEAEVIPEMSREVGWQDIRVIAKALSHLSPRASRSAAHPQIQGRSGGPDCRAALPAHHAIHPVGSSRGR